MKPEITVPFELFERLIQIAKTDNEPNSYFCACEVNEKEILWAEKLIEEHKAYCRQKTTTKLCRQSTTDTNLGNISNGLVLNEYNYEALDKLIKTSGYKEGVMRQAKESGFT